jgi:DNA-binding protein HU-beta
MNKNDLISYVAEATELTKTDATRAVEAVFDGITNGLQQNGEVKIVGFGTFSVSQRAATTGRNPRTGEEIKIAATKNAKFKAGKQLKDTVNDNASSSSKKTA